MFLVGTSRTDHSLGCIGCSLFLIYMTLAVLSWFVVGAVSLLAIKCNKWNGILIKSVVSAMAWGKTSVVCTFKICTYTHLSVSAYLSLSVCL